MISKKKKKKPSEMDNYTRTTKFSHYTEYLSQNKHHKQFYHDGFKAFRVID